MLGTCSRPLASPKLGLDAIEKSWFSGRAGACWEPAHAHLQAPELGLDVIAKAAGRRAEQHAPAVRPHARLGVPPRQRGQQLRMPPGQRGRRGRVHAARQRRQFLGRGRFQARQLCSCPAVRITIELNCRLTLCHVSHAGRLMRPP